MKILVTGKNGQVGSSLQKLLGNNAVFVGRDELDFSKPATLQAALGKLGKFDVIINTAAYTAVDKAESEPNLCDDINHKSVAELANYCKKTGTKLVHFSTDYVFDGSGKKPFKEENSTNLNPPNIYGKTKLAAEQAIIASGAEFLILRTSWVYNATGNNFARTMLKLGSEREELKIVADQIGSPSYAPDIAKAALELIHKKAAGIFHVVPNQQISWFEFANLIFARAKNLKVKNIIPITTAEYPTPAKRPLNSRLSSAKMHELGVEMPSIESSLQKFFELWTSAT